MKSLISTLLLITSINSFAHYSFSWGEISLMIGFGTTVAPTQAIASTSESTSEALTNNKLEHALIVKDSINNYNLTNEMSPLLSSAVNKMKAHLALNEAELNDEQIIDLIDLSLDEVF